MKHQPIMPATGSTVLHYEVGERIGAGGMGEVFRARDARLGREVALKFIAPPYRSDPDRRARLLKEARAASALRSPAIATTYDIAEDGQDLFIVMELVDGETLSDRLRRGPLTVPVTVQVATQVADALDEAHGLGIVHRDIKSANLVLTPRGRIKILDFGLAKITGPDSADAPTMAATQIGALVGTVSYMSPEQALGNAVDHRSDLFSLGVVLYEALTGRLPFDGETLAAVVDQIVRQEPPALAERSYDVPTQLQQIVSTLLAKAPPARYQSARELLDDLRALGQDLDNRSRTAVSRQASSPSRGAMPVPGPTQATIAVLPFVNITGEPVDDWIGAGIAETVTADLKTIGDLTVIGRERVFDAMRRLGSADARRLDDRLSIDVGHQLGATWLVSGGYQRLGELIRITARGVEVASGAVIRSVKIDGAISEIFALQDKIVYELSQGMNLTLHDSEVAAIARDETVSVEAYEARSRAMMNILEASPQSLDRAINLLEKATRQDPNYAVAWATLGMACDLKGSFLSLPDLSERAIEMERRAIALNPKLADAHRWLGLALLGLGRHDEAIEAIGEAARLEPGDANVYVALGRAYWIGQGRIDEGIRQLERAVELNPEIGYAYLQLGLLYALRGDHDDAEAACRQAVALQERSASGREGLQIVGAYTRLGYVFYLRGRYEEALELFERQVATLERSEHALKERSLIELRYRIGATSRRMGRQADADRYFAQALKAFERRLARGADDPFTKYYIAALCALSGDHDRALRYLGETLDQLPALTRARARVDPDLDGLRHDTRFAALLDAPPREA